MQSNANRKIFNSYCCELITNNEHNKNLIKDFEATEFGKSLENYLKEKAWEEDIDGETRVYLIKDVDKDIIVAFFSIKCGLLYESQKYEKLSKEEQEIVDIFIEATDTETINEYLYSGYYPKEQMEALYQIALDRKEVKNDNNTLHDDCYTLKVENCYSAIELKHFCRNAKYKLQDIEIPIGFGIFWEVIVPQICKVADLIGCKYVYLFAADKTGVDAEVKKLLEYYKRDLKFSDIQNLMIIKPHYDISCVGVMQDISKLRKNRDDVWEEFADILEE